MHILTEMVAKECVIAGAIIPRNTLQSDHKRREESKERERRWDEQIAHVVYHLQTKKEAKRCNELNEAVAARRRRGEQARKTGVEWRSEGVKERPIKLPTPMASGT